MSTEFYSKWFIKTKNKLEQVLDYDKSFIKNGSIKDRSLANLLIGGLYARYAMVVQELDACCDQMIQVQKNFTIRKLTDAAVERLNELKEELTKLDISEYHYIDGALVELKLVPHSVEIIHPSLVYPRNDKCERLWQRLKNNEQIYDPNEICAEGEEEAKKGQKKEKKKKVKVDPLALLQRGIQEEKAVEIEDEVGEEGEEEEEAEGEEIHQTSSKRLSRRSTRQGSVARLKEKKRPCLRPKPASQLEAEMSAEEKREKALLLQYLAAVVMIQAHERARQARLYVFDVQQERQVSIGSGSVVAVNSDMMQEDSVQKEEDDEEEEDKEEEDEEEVEEEETEPIVKESTVAFAIKIQKWWRGQIAKKRLRYREQKLRILIGMVRPSYKPDDEMIKLRRGLERRREARYEAIREYYQTLIDEKARVVKVVSPGLFEDIGDEIRQWFKDFYYTCKTFIDIPDPAEGGTVLVIRGDIETPGEHYQQMLESENKKGKKDNNKKKNDTKDDKKDKSKEKNKAEKRKKRNEPYEFTPEQTNAMTAMEEGFEEYTKLWTHINDAENPMNKPYMEPITDQMCYEVQMEVRPKVDELMRLELEMLRKAVLADKGKKGKGKKKKGKDEKNKEKKSKGSGGGKGKNKKKKDPTGNRKIEDLFQEMYQNGIIRAYPEVHIDQFTADHSYQNFERREALRDPPATLADAREAVIMNCIISLGVKKMSRPKAVLIAGPRQSGLDILANSVFNETQCVLFDLSPENIVGKYEGKKGNKDLTNLVVKMSKILQPSIIYIKDCERAFYKKVPKEEKDGDPKRVSKFLAKIIKPITPEDRVLCLGTSYYPFLANTGKMTKIFQKIILVPRPDYGSLYLHWENILMRYHGVDRNFNLSALTTLTRYYPLPEIEDAIERVLIPARIIQLQYKPLQAVELIDSLREGSGPITDDEWKKYEKFYGATKMGKARKVLTAGFAKIIEAEKKKEAQMAKKAK